MATEEPGGAFPEGVQPEPSVPVEQLPAGETTDLTEGGEFQGDFTAPVFDTPELQGEAGEVEDGGVFQGGIFGTSDATDFSAQDLQGATGDQTVGGEFAGIGGITGPVADLRGPRGPRGLEGVQGAQGDRGPQGTPGQTGPIGPMGNPGAQGMTGPMGTQGVQGPAASFEANAGAADTASVTLTGSGTTSDPYDLQFGLPRGNAGPTGPIGPIGMTGPQGLRGPQGDTGMMGDPGTPGEDGQDITNVTSVTGSTPGSDTSLTFFAGPDQVGTATIRGGAQGAPGSKGDKGDPGNPGMDGMDGMAGAAGQGITSVTSTGGTTPGSTTSLQFIVGSTEVGSATISSGVQGAPGAQGAQGNPGMDGDDGQGITNVTSTTGTNPGDDTSLEFFVGATQVGTATVRGGARGDDGDTGPTGPMGPMGNPGNPGMAGMDGQDGQGITSVTSTGGNALGASTNLTFNVGSTEVGTATIAAGERGERGLQGLQGTTGNPGMDGMDGTNGTNGMDGDDGQGVTSLVTTGGDNPGDSTNVEFLAGTTNVGTVSIPSGVQGVVGATGPAGPTGQPGPQGDPGMRGPQGFTGASGFSRFALYDSSLSYVRYDAVSFGNELYFWNNTTNADPGVNPAGDNLAPDHWVQIQTTEDAGGFGISTDNFPTGPTATAVFEQTVVEAGEDIKYYVRGTRVTAAPLSISISGTPSNSSVFTNLPNFTLTASATSGTLNSVTWNPAGTATTPLSEMYVGNTYEAAGAHAFTATGTGLDSDGDADTATRTTSFLRFIPEFVFTRASVPTAFSQFSGSRMQSTTITPGTKTGNQDFYFATTVHSAATLTGTVMGFPTTLPRVATGITQADQTGTTRSYNIYLLPLQNNTTITGVG